jgi:hypothetical protein
MSMNAARATIQAIARKQIPLQSRYLNRFLAPAASQEMRVQTVNSKWQVI